MPTPDRGFPSEPEKWLNAVAAAIRALKLARADQQSLQDSEVEVRGDWHNGATAYYGISVSDGGENPVDGVIGKEDVGYVALVTLVVRNDSHARTVNDPIMLWRSTIRRRFHNRRIAVDDLAEGTKRHVAKVVMRGRPRPPRGTKLQQFVGYQMAIIGWVRELSDDGE